MQISIRFGPCVAAGLSRTGYRETPPKVLTRFRIPAVQESADAKLSAGNARDEHTVGYERRDGHRVSVFPFRRFLPPDLPAILLIESHDECVQGGPEYFTVEDGRT